MLRGARNILSKRRAKLISLRDSRKGHGVNCGSICVTSGSLLGYEGMSGSLLCHFGSTSASILACEDDFGVTSESLFTYEVDFGITLRLLLAFEGGFGGALRPLEDHLWHMRSTLGALSGHFEVTLGLLWDHFGTT